MSRFCPSMQMFEFRPRLQAVGVAAGVPVRRHAGPELLPNLVLHLPPPGRVPGSSGLSSSLFLHWPNRSDMRPRHHLHPPPPPDTHTHTPGPHPHHTHIPAQTPCTHPPSQPHLSEVSAAKSDSPGGSVAMWQPWSVRSRRVAEKWEGRTGGPAPALPVGDCAPPAAASARALLAPRPVPGPAPAPAAAPWEDAASGASPGSQVVESKSAKRSRRRVSAGSAATCSGGCAGGVSNVCAVCGACVCALRASVWRSGAPSRPTCMYFNNNKKGPNVAHVLGAL